MIGSISLVILLAVSKTEPLGFPSANLLFSCISHQRGYYAKLNMFYMKGENYSGTKSGQLKNISNSIICQSEKMGSGVLGGVNTDKTQKCYLMKAIFCFIRKK